MTVTYRPANLKGITAGALRQVKQQGSTTAAGGWHLEDTIHKFAADTTLYLKPNEPLGGYMTSLKTAVEDTEAMTEALLKHANSMVEQARETNKKLNDLSGKCETEQTSLILQSRSLTSY
jgi:hypothetical protein